MSNWQIKKLGELLTIKHGRNQRAIETKDGIYPIFGTGGEIGRTNSFLCNKPSVLIGRKGTIDKPRYMDTPFWTVDTLFYSDVKNENCAKFLFYVFCLIDWYKYNEASGVPSLSASTVSSIKVVVPEKLEQQRIVSVLETWDEYLELLDKKIALKERLKKGLMQQLLTGKKRLPGFRNEWPKEKVVNVANISKGKALSSSGLGEGNIPVIAGGQTSPYTHSHFTHENAITVSASGAYAGYVSYHPYKIWASDCNVILEKEGHTDIHYLLHYLQFIQQKIYSLQTGGAQPHIYSKDLAILDINIPSLEEQRIIANILDRMSDGVLLLKSLRNEIEIQKKYLLQNLITGKIRTPDNLKIKEVNNA